MADNATLAHDELPLDEIPDRLMHARGCPKVRVEHYPATRPGDKENGIPPRELSVSRCLDCGGHYVKEQ